MKIVVKKISPETILLYLITFLTIFSTGSARTSTISAMNEYRRNGILLLFLMFPFVLQVVCKKRFNKKIVQMLLILVFYGVFLCTRNIESALHLLFRWTWFVFYYIVALKLFDESVDFLKFIYNIVKWLTIISLFFWVSITLFRFDFPYTVVNMDSFSYYNYYNVYYVANIYRVQLLGFDTYRMQSLFWEPGVFAIFLNFAIFYNIFYTKGPGKLLDIIMMFSALLLTFSTTGIIVGIGLLSIYLLQTKLLKLIKAVIALPVAGVAAGVMLQIWMNKRATSNYKMMSYALRMSDLTVGLRLWIENPIIGVGYNNTAVFEIVQGYGRGNSNGLITWAYTMGVIGIIAVFYPFIMNIMWRIKKHMAFFGAIVFLGLFIYANLTEPLQQSPFMVAMVAFQYAKLNLKRKSMN